MHTINLSDECYITLQKIMATAGVETPEEAIMSLIDSNALLTQKLWNETTMVRG